MRLSSFVNAAAMLAACSGVALGQVQFFNLGTLPGSEASINGSRANAVSGGGGVVAGVSQSSTGSRAFVWTAGSGMTALIGLPGAETRSSLASAVSADGRVIGGSALATTPDRPACRWTVLPGGGYGAAVGMGNAESTAGVNADGSVLVYYTGGHSTRWQSGATQELAPFPIDAAARGIDGSGDLVVGYGTFSGPLRGFFWTAPGGVQPLPVIPGSVGAQALGATGDGTLIVGVSGVDPVRWRRAGASWSIETYPMPPGTSSAAATQVSGDGRVATGTGSGQLWLWYRDRAPVPFQALLESRGVVVGGTILSVYGINHDGTAYVGQMRDAQQRPRAWVVRGLQPGCGSADFDGDGDTGTDFDIQAFFACVGGNCCATCGSADFNGDGDTGTDFDIQAFFRVMGGGSC